MKNEHREADYSAVFHILGAPGVRLRATPFVSDGRIDWKRLLAETRRMPAAQALLVRIARDLWDDGGEGVRLRELYRLDAAGFARVVDALTLARTGSLPPRSARAEGPLTVRLVA
jgi:hypothetical protein